MIGIAFCIFAVVLQLDGSDDAAWLLGVVGVVTTCIEKIMSVFDKSRDRANRRP